jgi:hypothetical protein
LQSRVRCFHIASAWQLRGSTSFSGKIKCSYYRYMLARPKRFELLTPRFVVKPVRLKLQRFFANWVLFVICRINRLHLACKPIGSVQARRPFALPVITESRNGRLVFPTRQRSHVTTRWFSRGVSFPGGCSVTPEKYIDLETGRAGCLFTVTFEKPFVREVQSLLRRLSLYDGPVDGVAGTKTKLAIRSFLENCDNHS